MIETQGTYLFSGDWRSGSSDLSLPDGTDDEYFDLNEDELQQRATGIWLWKKNLKII